MTGRTYNDQNAIRKWIDTYLDEYGMTSLRSIADWLKEKINEDVSPSTIKRLLEQKGIVFSKGEWEKK